jgi:hypothetical protein
MGILDDLSAKLWPHTAALTDTIERHREALERTSDIQKPDVEDKFHHIIRKGKFKGEATRLAQDVREQESAGPTLGEMWLFQSICVNGLPNASPTFTIRTNTGRLIVAVVKEGMGMETPGGDVAILVGEELIFEPSAEGTYDFTLTFRRIFLPRQRPDAGYGQSGERYDRPSHAFEHEIDRDFAGSLTEGQDGELLHATDEAYGGDISPDPIIAGEPAQTGPET